MKTMKKLFGIVLLLMASMVTSADELVKFDTNEFTGGKVEKTLEEVLLPEKEGDPVFIKVTITVIPDDDYYITKEDIVVMATYPLPETPAVNTRTEGEEEKKPEFANQIELVGDDPQYLKEKRFYTFTIEKGFGVWVTEANFKQAATEGKFEGSEVSWSLKTFESKGGEGPKLILTLEGEGAASLGEGSAPWSMQKSAITNLVVSKGITAFGAGLLSGCDNLTNIEIQNAESVITLGEGAIPANEGLAIDVPGNIFNKYQMNDGWKGFNVDSKNKVLMGKVKFVEDKNNYDVFAPEQDMKVPVGVFAYSVNKIKGDEILLEDVATISKGKVVLLYSEEIQTKELYTAAIPESANTRADKDDEPKERICELKVVTKDPNKKDEDQGLDVKLGQVYMLYNDVFYPTQAGRIPVGGIYLEIKEDKKDEVVTKTRSFLTIGGVADDADDAITAIDNSPLSIVHCPLSTSWYDLRGRKLNGAPTTKGVYINNGKKLIIR
jgi:hypothetical protein